MKKYAIVTGSSGGIGEKIVIELINIGIHVIAIDKDNNHDEFDKECCDEIYVDLNQLSKDSIYSQRILDKIHNIIKNGELVMLVNNAAKQIVKSFQDLSSEDINDSFLVNVTSHFILTQFFYKYSIQGGYVFNITSIHSKLTKKDFLAYSTSKSALNGLSKAMAVEIGHKNTCINISPAAIETDMLKSGFKDKRKLNLLKACHPTGVIGKPEDVARLIVKIYESQVFFLNGAEIDLAGGINYKLMDPEN